MKTSLQCQPYVLLQPSSEFAEGVRPLNEDELAHFRNMQVQNGAPVRFLHHGGAVDIVSGQKQAQGLPDHFQIHYWNFSRETAQQIAKATGTIPVFAN